MWGQTHATGVRGTRPNPTANTYTAGDGERFWLVGLEGDRHWPALLRAIDRIEWLDDERFLTRRERAINARELVAELDAIFATRPRAEWAAGSDAQPEAFWGAVNTIEHLAADQQSHASGPLATVPGDDRVARRWEPPDHCEAGGTASRRGEVRPNMSNRQ